MVCAVLLSGCGGGAAGPGSTVTTDFPVESVLRQLASAGGTFTATAKDGAGNNYQLDLSIAPNTPKTGFGGYYNTYTRTTIIRRNGSVISTKALDTYYGLPFSLFGTIDNLGGTTVMTNQTPLPATAKSGGSGAFYFGRRGSLTETGTWSLDESDSGTAFLCINNDEKSDDVSSWYNKESVCFKINSSGSILGIKVTVASNLNSTGTNPQVVTMVFQ